MHRLTVVADSSAALDTRFLSSRSDAIAEQVAVGVRRPWNRGCQHNKQQTGHSKNKMLRQKIAARHPNSNMRGAHQMVAHTRLCGGDVLARITDTTNSRFRRERREREEREGQRRAISTPPLTRLKNNARSCRPPTKYISIDYDQREP